MNINRKKLTSRTLIPGLALLAGLFSYALLETPTVKADAINDTDFVITVKSDNIGPSADNEFTIPTSGTGYNYTVDCNNDGVHEVTGQTGDYTCVFASPGTYTIRIAGDFPRIHFNNEGDRLKILQVNQWGNNPWTSMSEAFYGATNLDVVATDVPDLSNVTDMSRMFYNATFLVGNSSFNNWDTSNVTNMRTLFGGT